MNDHRQPLSQRVISIRTPENIELSYALAGPGSRAAAYVIDLLIMFVVCQMLINLLVSARRPALAAPWARMARCGPPRSRPWLSFALYNGYFIFLEWLMNGQTPGKRLLHIRVIKQGGYSLRFFDTLLRNLLRVDRFPAALLRGGADEPPPDPRQPAAGRPGRRHAGRVPGARGDRIAAAGSRPPPTESEPPLPAVQLAAIPDEAIALAAQYLRSRNEMAPRPRQEVAAELVNLIRETSGLEPRPAQGVESFLASVVRQAEQAPPSSSPTPQQAELPS